MKVQILVGAGIASVVDKAVGVGGAGGIANIDAGFIAHLCGIGIVFGAGHFEYGGGVVVDRPVQCQPSAAGVCLGTVGATERVFLIAIIFLEH